MTLSPTEAHVKELRSPSQGTVSGRCDAVVELGTSPCVGRPKGLSSECRTHAATALVCARGRYPSLRRRQFGISMILKHGIKGYIEENGKLEEPQLDLLPCYWIGWSRRRRIPAPLHGPSEDEQTRSFCGSVAGCPKIGSWPVGKS